jgi:quaternary ammonium compound-resistance protein SugE
MPFLHLEPTLVGRCGAIWSAAGSSQVHGMGDLGEAVMAWAILVGAGLLEIVWAISLKYTDGFTRFWPSAIGITAALVSFLMLGTALKSLPVGTAHAVWVGVGAIGVAITGTIALGESASLLRIGLLALILIGIIGLKSSRDEVPGRKHLSCGREPRAIQMKQEVS